MNLRTEWRIQKRNLYFFILTENALICKIPSCLFIEANDLNVFWHSLHVYNIPLWTDSMCILRIILVSAGMIFVLTHHQRSSFLIRNIHTNLFSSLFYDNSCNTNEFTYLYWYVSLLRTKWWNCWYYSIIDLHNFDKCSITAPSHYDKSKSRELPKIGVCNPTWVA